MNLNSDNAVQVVDKLCPFIYSNDPNAVSGVLADRYMLFIIERTF
jgi:hypothetical protein